MIFHKKKTVENKPDYEELIFKAWVRTQGMYDNGSTPWTIKCRERVLAECLDMSVELMNHKFREEQLRRMNQ